MAGMSGEDKGVEIMRVRKSVLGALMLLGAYGASFMPAQAQYADVQAEAEVRLMQMEEKLRRMTGQLEELQHAIKQLKQADATNKADLLYRLQALEGAAQGAEAVAPAATPVQMPPVAAISVTTPATAVSDGAAVPGNAAAPTAPPAETAQAAPATTGGEEVAAGGNTQNLTQPSTNDSRQAYNQAFQLLNQARFAEARTALQGFIDRYPSDPLIGNAYYWLGETHYVERDYLKAADTFRQGFEKGPEGPKAPDNLLKLGMSMAAMGKTTEACVVYKQLAARYENAGASITQKIKQERTRLDCR